MEKPANTLAEVKVQVALDFAAACHRYQWRKGTGTPYLIHVLTVTNRLAMWGILKEAHTDLWCASLLHDTIEDTSATIKDIVDRLGEPVGRIVTELTFRDRAPDETGRHYAEAKNEYLSTFDSKSIEALVIKIADRLSNVEDFLASDSNYAVKYWDKADPQFQAMDKRRTSIDQCYGSAVWTGLAADYASVRSRIEAERLS